MFESSYYYFCNEWKNSGIAAQTSIWSSQRFIPTRIKGLFYLLQTNSFSCSTKCTFYFTSFVSAAVIYILYIIKYLYENGSCKLKVTIQLFLLLFHPILLCKLDRKHNFIQTSIWIGCCASKMLLPNTQNVLKGSQVCFYNQIKHH